MSSENKSFVWLHVDTKSWLSQHESLVISQVTKKATMFMKILANSRQVPDLNFRIVHIVAAAQY